MSEGEGEGVRSRLTANDLAVIRQQLAASESRTDACDLPDAGPVVVKRRRPARSRWRARGMAALSRATGLALLRPVAAPGGARGEAIELGRLDALARAGVRVPEVLHAEPGFFVMRRFEGRDLAERIAERGDAGFAAWRAGLDAIADVHARGACLSQAFARNLLATPDGIAFIDFEDDPLATLPLDVAQARDWLAYLHSTAWLLDGDGEGARAALDAALSAVTEGRSAAATRAARRHVLEAGRRLAPFRRLPASRRPLGREALGLRALARLLA